jgi:two-component system response regulator (stage 0 sporulation protein A)
MNALYTHFVSFLNYYSCTAFSSREPRTGGKLSAAQKRNAAMNKSTPFSQAYALMSSLSITARHRGAVCLSAAVCLVADNEDLLFGVTKFLYPLVAQCCNTSWRCVEHNMRTAITACWENGGRPGLEILARRPLDEKPTPTEFIEILASHLVRSGTSPPPEEEISLEPQL